MANGVHTCVGAVRRGALMLFEALTLPPCYIQSHRQLSLITDWTRRLTNDSEHFLTFTGTAFCFFALFAPLLASLRALMTSSEPKEANSYIRNFGRTSRAHQILSRIVGFNLRLLPCSGYDQARGLPTNFPWPYLATCPFYRQSPWKMCLRT